MHTDLLAVALAFMVSGTGHLQGAITAVTVEAPAGQSEVVVTVRGNNPCGAVTVDYGDGTKITHALVALPTTFAHQYTKVGDYQVSAGGNGNCGGQVSTSIRVRPSHVRAPQPQAEPAKPADRLAAVDAIDLDGNGRVTAEEWKGTDAVFRTIDQDGDGGLSRTEVEEGAVEVFASLDENGDRRISPREWRTARQSFDSHDRNGDGLVTPAEFGVPGGAVGAAGRRGTAGARGQGRGQGQGQERTVVVRASEAWTDTGITVRPGELLTFAASGTIRMSSNADDVAIPRGAKSGRQIANAPVPDGPAGALIARVGNSAPILIGDQTDPVRMSSGGRLFLGVNDDHFDDNGGMFRVTIAPAR
jgi:hypothetical protein